ncbi:MAG: hypothetical protein KatS3mg124_1615 [Porticoccaceae bacterium]|nr:MAG: hypothetical protein KatS3mg124_1615 [Porticoccaceae bacterium]
MSFAELQTGIVVKDPEVRKPWTRDLEWIPDLLKDEDLAFFSHLLVIGPPQKHQALADRYRLIPVVRSHDVGLYENADGAWQGFPVDRRVTDFDQGHHNGSR